MTHWLLSHLLAILAAGLLARVLVLLAPEEKS
jgi:hypothetical protein